MCEANYECHEQIHYKHCKYIQLNINGKCSKYWTLYLYFQDGIIQAFSGKVEQHMIRLLRQYKETVSCLLSCVICDIPLPYEGSGLFLVPQVACIPDDNDLFNHGDTVSYQARVSVVVVCTVF